MALRRGHLGILLVLAIAGAMGGCASRLLPIQQSFRQGDFQTAAKEARQYARSHDGGSPQAVLAHIEHGSMARMVGNFQESDAAFARAEARMARLDRSPGISAGERVSAMASTPDRIAYEGFFYDRQFVAAYRAINAMAMGDVEDARQHFVRADRWQTFAIIENRGRAQQLRDDQAAARSKRAGFDQSAGDSRLESELNERYGNLEQYEAYADFANPYVDMLRAIYLMGVAESVGDYDVARNLLRRVAGMAPNNPYVLEDLDLADALAQGEAEKPDLVYVFFETGLAPFRAQTRISVPVFLVTDRVQIVPIAAPYLVFDDRYVETLYAEAGSNRRNTALLASVDRIVAAEFRAQLPGLKTRMIAAAALKVGVQFGMNEALRRSDPLIRIAAMLGGAIWAASTNEADLRTWATLPKQVQYTRVPAPADGDLSLAFGSRRIDVPVEPEGITLVVVRSVRDGSPPLVISTPLKPEPWTLEPTETQ
ncbi:MAG: hypothetical protein ACIAQU_09735 [Phycisphaerales bacterium JB064]